MPLEITINRGEAPTPQDVPQERIAEKAREQGARDADRAVAITMPFIQVVQTRLSYEQRRGEFRFTNGTLVLNLRQEIWMADNLSERARARWLVHENEHVTDNQALMSRMDAAVRADAAIIPVWITPTWISRSLFQSTQTRMREAIGAIFRSFTERAVAARDTQAEYDRVRREAQ